MTTGFVAARLLEFFLLGILTPLTAVCVIPLYPAFIAFLASGSENPDGTPRSVLALGLLVVAGVLAFMAVIGVVFTMVLQVAISNVVETVSPIAFGILAIVGLFLLVNPSVFSSIPTVDPPQSKYPGLTAFGYGFFFGAIIIPCNPGLIALFFARVPVLFDTTIHSLLGFLSFGLGIGAPLLMFALVSEPYAHQVTRFLTSNSKLIYQGNGVILLAVSVYYLTIVFAVIPFPS